MASAKKVKNVAPKKNAAPPMDKAKHAARAKTKMPKLAGPEKRATKSPPKAKGSKHAAPKQEASSKTAKPAANESGTKRAKVAAPKESKTQSANPAAKESGTKRGKVAVLKESKTQSANPAAKKSGTKRAKVAALKESGANGTKLAAPKDSKTQPANTAAHKEPIICGAHGETPATFVCVHLAEGVACGFHANPPAPDDPWPDAWCDLCEEAFQAGGGKWTPRAEKSADIKVLCTYCYDDSRARNTNVPELARGAKCKLSKAESGELVHRAVHHAQDLQKQTDKKLRWDSMSRWDIDHDANTITFTNPKGRVTADIRWVGSYSTNTNTFQWAWETFDDAALPIAQLRRFGEVRGMKQLTIPNWECEEITGWEMTSLAAYLLGADAVYGAQMQHLRWFMLLSGWRQST